MTMSELYKEAKGRLSAEGADFLLSQLFRALFKAPLIELQIKGLVPDEEQIKKLFSMIDRLNSGYPLQYLLGEWEFYGIPLKVGEGVLIPRPDTEILVDIAAGLLKGRKSPVAADLCSGSGAIALALASVIPDACLWAVELSSEALGYLRENIALNRMEKRIRILQADVLTALPLSGLDLIVSNPPYIRRREIPGLPLQLAAEPVMALDGGEDGLVFYRAICKKAAEMLKPDGSIVFEVGYDQAQQVAELLRTFGFEEIRLAKDLGHIDRCVYGTYKN